MFDVCADNLGQFGMLQLYRNGAEIKSFYTWRPVFCSGGNSDFQSFFPSALAWPLVARCHTTSSCVGFAASPHGNGSGPMLGVRKPSRAALGISVTGGMGWTGHSIAAASSHPPGALAWKVAGSSPTGSEGQCSPSWVLLERGGTWAGKARRGSVSAFMRLPTSFCSCAHTDFFPGSNEDRAEADFILEQCFISLCNSVYFPWAKPNGKYLLDCKETLITVARSSLWLNSCHFKSLGTAFSIA